MHKESCHHDKQNRHDQKLFLRRALGNVGRPSAVCFWSWRRFRDGGLCLSDRGSHQKLCGETREGDTRKYCLTTLVRGLAIGPMQRACYQSIAMAREVVMRQEQWKDG